MNESTKVRLRVAVAAEVMGLEHVGEYEYCELKQGNRTWFGYCADWMFQELESWKSVQIVNKSGVKRLMYWPRLEEVPEYESDIAAAWQVLLHLFEQGWWMNPFAYFHSDGWSLHLKHKEHEHVYIDAAESDCLAICLAAYKAVTGKDFDMGQDAPGEDGE